MPRLLLVDDNPSIHRIAESLLASTDVELICVDSAAEALDRLGRGERFDVALVDTAMPGMDGWTLLARLRAMEETAMMPIALMAGVLDPVDPAKLAKAPIQGFLKKPIELRELGDRVKALLVTPVTVSPSPFSTVPATPARDLVKRAEAALPELRPEPIEPSAGHQAEALPQPEPDEDLLVLTAEDLWPEVTPPVVPEPALPAPVYPDVQLDLEELDLDSLQDLTNDALPPARPMATEAQAELAHDFDPGSLLPEDEDVLVTLSGLEELEALPADFRMVLPEPEPAPVLEPMAEQDDFSDLPVAASLIGVVGMVAVSGHSSPSEPDHEAHEHEAVDVIHTPAPVLAPALEIDVPAAGGQPPAAPGQGATVSAEQMPVSSDQARAVVQAMRSEERRVGKEC